MKRLALLFGVLLGLGVLGVLLLQLVPYGKDHTNPPVLQEPNWDSPETRQLVKQACFDCHSNETVWPWYSNIAPVSWLVYRDVEKGRHELNFSEWGRGEMEIEDVVEVVQEGEMPMPIYLIQHPEARYDAQQKQSLLDGLQATFGGEIRGDDDED